MKFERSNSALSDLDESSSSSLSGSFKEESFMERSPMQRHGKHSIAVAAMLSSNLMRDCSQVKDMHLHCLERKTGKDSAICNTAMQYFASCAMGKK
jgi:hypothetical protein